MILLISRTDAAADHPLFSLPVSHPSCPANLFPPQRPGGTTRVSRRHKLHASARLCTPKAREWKRPGRANRRWLVSHHHKPTDTTHTPAKESRRGAEMEDIRPALWPLFLSLLFFQLAFPSLVRPSVTPFEKIFVACAWSPVAVPPHSPSPISSGLRAATSGAPFWCLPTCFVLFTYTHLLSFSSTCLFSLSAPSPSAHGDFRWASEQPLPRQKPFLSP